jgi:hypothetical protein
LDDPTLKVALGDNVKAKYKPRFGKEITGFAEVPVDKRVFLKIKKLQNNNLGNETNYISNSQVQDDLQYTREILAQVGVDVSVISNTSIRPPDGVDLVANGLQCFTFGKDEAPTDGTAIEELTLFGPSLVIKSIGENGQPKYDFNSIRRQPYLTVYYVNYMTTLSNTKPKYTSYFGSSMIDTASIALSGSPMRPGQILEPRTGDDPRTPQTVHPYITLAHEILHLITEENAAHFNMYTGNFSDLNSINLLVDGNFSRTSNLLTDSRRIVNQQEGKINGQHDKLRSILHDPSASPPP